MSRSTRRVVAAKSSLLVRLRANTVHPQLTIDDTVEDRILTLQADKAQLAKAALDGGNIGKLNKLSVKEILYLFKANARP